MMLAATLLLAHALHGVPASSDSAGEQERAKVRAENALQAARSAVKAASAKKTAPPQASQHLKTAEQLCRSSKFEECASAADAAWRMVSSGNADESTRFAVEVQEDGSTKVQSQSGKPVQVNAQGVTRAVGPGQAVRVAKGEAPTEPVVVPAAPSLKAPAASAQIKLKPSAAGLGPVTLAWHPVQGASSYEVTVLGPKEPALALDSKTSTLKLPPLPPGLYRWTVRAVAHPELRSGPSEERSFELSAQTAEEPLKLEVKGGGWK